LLPGTVAALFTRQLLDTTQRLWLLVSGTFRYFSQGCSQMQRKRLTKRQSRRLTCIYMQKWFPKLCSSMHQWHIKTLQPHVAANMHGWHIPLDSFPHILQVDNGPTTTCRNPCETKAATCCSSSRSPCNGSVAPGKMSV